MFMQEAHIILHGNLRMSVGLMASWASCAFFTFLEYFGGLRAAKSCPYLHTANLNHIKNNQNMLKPHKISIQILKNIQLQTNLANNPTFKWIERIFIMILYILVYNISGSIMLNSKRSIFGLSSSVF